MNANHSTRSLCNLVRAYRLAQVAFRHSPEHAEMTAEDPVALRTIVPARDALLELAEIRCDVDAAEALLLAGELAGKPLSLANDSVASHLIALVAAHLGRRSSERGAPASPKIAASMTANRACLADASDLALEAIVEGAERAKATMFDALDSYSDKGGPTDAFDDVVATCNGWMEAAALELRARLIRGEVRSDELAARVLLRACLAEDIFPLGASVLAAAAAEALGELEAA